ncbi:hypothetical protein B0H16DRAFT_1455124 [Mycena metata]|uniref:Uncharacterized protein n=1 Tax=Mycena metata TaxID=1033252 RepID=A0AAD7JGF7_9AGAR|nr:hypothetical protein B0H16DRAFT_1455124 [Mycena metata]
MRTRSSKIYGDLSNSKADDAPTSVSDKSLEDSGSTSFGARTTRELASNPIAISQSSWVLPADSPDKIRRIPKLLVVLNDQTTRDLQAALGRNKRLSLRNSELILAFGKKRAENLELKRVVSVARIDSVKNHDGAKDALMDATQCPVCYLPMIIKQPQTSRLRSHLFPGLFGELVCRAARNACKTVQLSDVQKNSKIPAYP